MTRQSSISGLEAANGRPPDDFYVTPAWVTQAIVPWLGQPSTVLDIGCGSGAIGKVLRVAWPGCVLYGVERDRGRVGEARSLRDTRGDAVYTYVHHADWEDDVNPLPGAELIISNPPFGARASLAFLRKALLCRRTAATVAFLLPGQWHQETEARRGRERLNFLDSLRTADGREGYGVYSIEGRICFRGATGPTDRICYAWLVFGPGHEGIHRRVPVRAAVTGEQRRLL